MSGGSPSMTSIARQPSVPTSKPESGADNKAPTGRQSWNSAFAEARSSRGNQRAISTSTAGHSPPSATPSRKRAHSSCRSVCARPLNIAHAAQTIISSVTHSLAPQRSAI